MPLMPRRGRAALTDTDVWGDSGRMVHRKVDHPTDSAESAAKGIFEQLAEDRAAMVQLHGAIQAIAKAVNSHSDSIHNVESRLEETIRMRFDDHRLNVGAINHVRTGV